MGPSPCRGFSYFRLCGAKIARAVELALVPGWIFGSQGHQSDHLGRNVFFGGDTHRAAYEVECKAPTRPSFRRARQELLDNVGYPGASTRDHAGSILAKENSMWFIEELWRYIRARRKYWLLTILLMMGLFGYLLVFTQGSAIAPFIYTIF